MGKVLLCMGPGMKAQIVPNLGSCFLPWPRMPRRYLCLRTLWKCLGVRSTSAKISWTVCNAYECLWSSSFGTRTYVHVHIHMPRCMCVCLNSPLHIYNKLRPLCTPTIYIYIAPYVYRCYMLSIYTYYIPCSCMYL